MPGVAGVMALLQMAPHFRRIGAQLIAKQLHLVGRCCDPASNSPSKGSSVCFCQHPRFAAYQKLSPDLLGVNPDVTIVISQNAVKT